MKNQKGQLIIIVGIVLFLAVIGGVIAFQFLGREKDSKEILPAEEQEETVQETSDGNGFFSRLFGGTSQQEEAVSSGNGGFFSRLFGGGTEETKEQEDNGNGFFSRLFGGTSQQEEAVSSGNGGFFSRLFGGGDSGVSEKVGVDTETAESPETAPPKRSNASPLGELPYYTRQANISLNTDKTATCRYETVKGLSYDSMKLFSNTNSTFHSTEVSGFNEGQKYTYYVKCQDQNGNKNKEDFIISFEIGKPKDVTPPTRVHPYPSGDIFAAGTKSTLISIATDEPAFCRYDSEQGKDYNSMSRSFSRNEAKIYHTSTVTGLEDGKYYTYFVRCIDEAGNKNTGDVMISFSIRTQ